MLIDDGNMDRDNRREFFNPSLHDIGIGIGTHAKYQFVIIMILATRAEKKEVRQHRLHSNRHSAPQLEAEEAHAHSARCRGCRIF